jgi:hypothetical protein
MMATASLAQPRNSRVIWKLEPGGSAAPPASRVASKKSPAQRGALVTCYFLHGA